MQACWASYKNRLKNSANLIFKIKILLRFSYQNLTCIVKLPSQKFPYEYTSFKQKNR